MLAKLKSHIDRVLSPYWTESVEDTTPAHGNKTVSIGEVCKQLFWGILSDRRNLREIETQSEIVGERLADTTMNDVLVRLSVGSLPELIASQVKRASADKELVPVGLPFNLTSIDGKNLYTGRAYVDQTGATESATKRRNMALRAALVSAASVQVLGQRMIPDKSAETTEFIPFMQHLEDLYGKTKFLEAVTVDAGMTHLKNADFLHEKGIIYIMALKENQPILYNVAQKLTKQQAPKTKTTDNHSGREITREITIVKVKGNFSRWWHATEIWKVEQTSVNAKTGESIAETRFFITNMPKAKASARQKLLAVRRHWRVENDAFWTLDAIFNEDKCPFSLKALELVSYIRIMAFNIAARFRARRLRSKKNRNLRWKDFIQYYQALFIQHSLAPTHPT
jgi:predicted transposase YbfD/YdcC